MSQKYNVPETNSLDSMEGLEVLPTKEKEDEEYWLELAREIEEENLNPVFSLKLKRENIWINEWQKAKTFMTPDDFDEVRKSRIRESSEALTRQVEEREDRLMTELSKIRKDPNPDYEFYSEVAKLWTLYRSGEEHAFNVIASYWFDRGNREKFLEALSKSYTTESFFYKKFLKDFDDKWAKGGNK